MNTSSTPRALLLAFAAGLLFALGLAVSGMTQPDVVQGFLYIAGAWQGPFPGAWNPTLAFVMGGAVSVTLVAFAVTPRAGRKPWLAETFALPTRRDIDGRLLAGSALFGVGWGLAGYCPGPALASLLTGWDAALFVPAMLAGMAIGRRFR